MKFRMTYPENKKVDDSTLMNWAIDICTEKGMNTPDGIFDAISILEYHGLATIGNYGMPLSRKMTEEEKTEVLKLEDELGEGFREHSVSYFSSARFRCISERIRKLTHE